MKKYLIGILLVVCAVWAATIAGVAASTDIGVKNFSCVVRDDPVFTESTVWVGTYTHEVNIYASVYNADGIAVISDSKLETRRSIGSTLVMTSRALRLDDKVATDLLKRGGACLLTVTTKGVFLSDTEQTVATAKYTLPKQ